MCPFDCVVLQMASETYHNLKAIIKGKYGMESTSVGDEGGFAPKVQDSKEALDLVVEAIEAAGYTGKIEIGMDVAASEFYNAETKMYDLDFKTEGEEKDEKLLMPGDQLNDLYVGFCNDYPMASIEDPFDQEVGTWSIAPHRDTWAGLHSGLVPLSRL
jgi:enolase|eukprot:COSAG03_NODE_12281_length_554_cov_0.797802_1_plen_158_part_00